MVMAALQYIMILLTNGRYNMENTDIKKQSWDNFIDCYSFMSSVMQFRKERPEEFDKIIIEVYGNKE